MLKRYPVFTAFIILVLIVTRLRSDPDRAAKSSSSSQPPQTIEVLETLDSDVLRQRSIETFPSGYLNSISIIQGVALAALIGRTFSSWPDAPTLLQGTTIALEALFLLFGIIVVAYEYLWFLTVVRWTPTFRDTLVPFTLGVSEIVPQFFIGRPTAWWIGVGIFTLAGALAFYNTANRLRPNLFGAYRHVHDRILAALWKLIGCCLALTSVAALMMSLSLLYPDPLIGAVVMLALLSMTALVVYLSEAALDGVYADLNIKRRPTKCTG